jgi:hypothetical protein
MVLERLRSVVAVPFSVGVIPVKTGIQVIDD